MKCDLELLRNLIKDKYQNNHDVIIKTLNVINKINIPHYEVLFELLESLTNNDDFKYLNAYTNHSKHRHIVNPNFNIGINNVKEFGFSFDTFKYKEKHYEKRKVDNFLTSEYNREFKLIIQIENELISILKDEKPKI